MKKHLFIITLIIFLSCESRTKYEKPSDLISKDQMVDLLTDLHLANGITGIKSKNELKVNNYISFLYEKYNIDSTRFASSNLYYISNIIEYEKMLKEVKKRIESQRILFEEDSIMIRDSKGKKLKRPSIKKRNKESILK